MFFVLVERMSVILLNALPTLSAITITVHAILLVALVPLAKPLPLVLSNSPALSFLAMRNCNCESPAVACPALLALPTWPQLRQVCC